MERVKSLAARVGRRVQRPAMNTFQVLDSYADEAPSPQAAVDIFAGEFSSRLPREHGDLRAGEAALFEDGRIMWLADMVDLTGLDVLELGPLEAGHSYMLQAAGAARVTAIEANNRAYLKCLVVKEIFGLDRVDLLYGNFVEYLRDPPRRFDLCVASGVLYHMRNPVELLARIAAVTDQVFLWTHYYDREAIAANPALAAHFTGVARSSHDDLSLPVHRCEYGAPALGSRSFCGGSAEYAFWMERDGILSCLRHHGFEQIDVAFEQTDDQAGPSFALVARRG